MKRHLRDAIEKSTRKWKSFCQVSFLTLDLGHGIDGIKKEFKVNARRN
jgi:hypothetical protein